MAMTEYFDWPSTDVDESEIVSWVELDIWELEGVIARKARVWGNPYPIRTPYSLPSHDAWQVGNEGGGSVLDYYPDVRMTNLLNLMMKMGGAA